MKQLVGCLVGLLLGGLCSAVPAGREFATVFMQNYASSTDTRFLVEVGALPTSRGPTKVKVTAMGQSLVKEVSPGKSESFKLPSNVEMKGSKRSQQTVLIEASQDVTVVSLNYKHYTADTSVVYPVKDWGTEYVIFTPSGTQNGAPKEFSIVNHRERNNVEVLLQGTVQFLGRVYRKGSKLTLKLEPFESVQIQSQDNLSGTKVNSLLPVAVSSGHSCVQKYTGCNHVYEQLLPVNNWGKEFIIAPLPYHQSFLPTHDSIFIHASEPTKLKININGEVHERKLFPGKPYELDSKWPKAVHLTADKGVQVLFEFNGGPKYDNEYFDPFLMTILPTEHFSKSYSVEGQQDFRNKMIVVARNQDLDSIKIDPQPVSKNIVWQKVHGSDFSWAEIHYSNGANFYQISSSKSPFGVYSFGLALANGYGSPASADVAEKHDCTTIKCSEDEVCRMKEDSPTCVKKAISPGTCWAMGDPHYRTFDGSYYNFMGSCTYTMVKNCHSDGNHPAFEVDAQNNKIIGSKVTFVGKVIVNVYGYTMTIVQSEFGLIRMNYTLWNLPITLDGGRVRLYQSGLSVIVETDFGLTVQYDWKEYLLITVPGSFSGKVCGLCGNFNNKKDDDLLTPSGTLADSPVALGKSWRVHSAPDDNQCKDECPGQCESCDNNSIFGTVTDHLFCGLLAPVMEGPLRDCKALIDPKVFHEICLYDVCMGEGKKNFLCNSLQVYADACQRSGIKIYDWRNLAKCPAPTCPENSHYEFCGNACPNTCNNPDAAAKCKKGCVETCVCDKGFVLSGTECVPNSQCGCLYKGHYVESGASFFNDYKCSETCTCNSATKKVECKKQGCKPGYECKLVDDLIGCHALEYAECSVFEGPHFETFDGYDYNFHGTCVYQLAGVCSKNTSLQHFEVIVQNDASDKQASSGAQLVELKVSGLSIVITRKHKGAVLINGEIRHLPANPKSMSIYQSGEFAEIKTDFGLIVSYDWSKTVHVKVPSAYAHDICGLCGNFNYNPKDDTQLKNGALAESVEAFGKHWRVAEIPGCVDGCKDNNECPSCDITQKQKYETDLYCGLIKKPDGPFRECHSTINPEKAYKNCLYDVCLYNGKNGSWCSHLRRYTIACQQKGINVSQWRNPDFCPISKMKLPPNTKYEHCANMCHPTCDTGRPPVGCKKPCQEGWVCKDGYILSGNKCVPLRECGCHYNKQYYKKGEKILSPDCRKLCTCDGEMNCEAHSCGLSERCELNNGVRLCKPVGKATCTISGDPHYQTFDQVHYDFQGTCTYTAASACHLQGTSLTNFSVVVENDKWTGTNEPNLSVAHVVIVEVYGHTIILRRNQLYTVLVDGIVQQIPFNLDDGKVEVFLEGTHYAITTDFGLNVTYDMVYRVTVTVPGNYQGRTCGLCSNFNGNKADEFQLPDGKLTKDLKTFGAAWKVGVENVVCEDGCTGDQCPKCDGEKKKIFENDCSIITNPTGKFATCHDRLNPEPYYRDCVYDVCMANGDRKTLCQSITAYMSDCQSIGVIIPNWRSQNFCPINCPPNSHYEICAETCSTPCYGLMEIITCPITCAEGCACNEGYYFNGTGCVARESCGCYHDGRTYKIGETVLYDQCQQKCTCTAAGDIDCVETSCDVTEKCQVVNGTLGCHAKECRLDAEGSFTLFSGNTGIISVMGAYEIIAHCDQSAVDWFRAVAVLQECPLSGVKRIAAVYVFFNEMSITVTEKHETWVNGKKVTLPISHSERVSVRVTETSILVEEMSRFQLHFTNNQEVVVTVSDSMAEKVCGACDKFVPLRDLFELSEDVMQEYMSGFSADDFPTCDL